MQRRNFLNLLGVVVTGFTTRARAAKRVSAHPLTEVADEFGALRRNTRYAMPTPIERA